jgi:hypothetical protein
MTGHRCAPLKGGHKAMVSRRTPISTSDLRGAVRLAAGATAGLTDLVEAMHERIARAAGFGPEKLDGRTSGLTGLVYETIRGVARVAGGSAENLLSVLASALEKTESGTERDAIVAVLNGVLGDYLAASSNPLATPMSFRREGRSLVLQTPALAATLPEAGARVLVMLHGLCMNDRQWLRDGHDHGAALARERGFTPVYLHYNSGLHVSTNGQMLAHRLGALAEPVAPCPIERFALLGHSMGGLLARSAHHYGTQAHHQLARTDDRHGVPWNASSRCATGARRTLDRCRAGCDSLTLRRSRA